VVFKKFYKYYKEEGFTLITVLFILVILMLYIVSLFSLSQSSLGQSSHNRDYSGSFSAAEAGLSMTIYHINEDVYWPGTAADPNANWGEGITSWQDLPDVDSQYMAYIYNNYHCDFDKATASGERVPKGSIHVNTIGRLEKGSNKTEIKTFFKT